MSVPCAVEMSKHTSERGQPLQPELALQLVHRVGRALLALERRELELLQQVARVLLREVDQLAPRAALRRR